MNSRIMIMIHNNIDMGFFIFYFCLQRGVGQTARQQSTATESSMTYTIEQAFQKQTAYAPPSQRDQELFAAIAYCVARDMMPLRAVERPRFLRMMKVAVLHFKGLHTIIFQRLKSQRCTMQSKLMLR